MINKNNKKTAQTFPDINYGLFSSNLPYRCSEEQADNMKQESAQKTTDKYSTTLLIV